MFLGYGIAIAIIIEWWRRRKDRFKDPTASWMTDFVRDELLPVDQSRLSPEAKYEHFLKRYNRQWRDKYGSESVYRLTTIAGLVELYIKQKRFYEARGWQRLAIQIMEFNHVSGNELAVAHDCLADLELRMGQVTEACHCYRKAALMYRGARNFEALANNLSAHFDVLAKHGMLADALSLSDELVEVLEVLHGPISLALEQHLLHAESALARDNIPERRRRFLQLLISLHVSEQALGADHTVVAGDLRRLASFFALSGKEAVASALSQRASMIMLLNKVDGVVYPGIERDLITVADWLESRNKGADRTVAFHMRKRAERIAEKRLSTHKR